MRLTMLLLAATVTLTGCARQRTGVLSEPEQQDERAAAAQLTNSLHEPSLIPDNSDAHREEHGSFTGDVKLVLYVKDVCRSVEFYRGALGFRFHSFHDYVTGKNVTEWTRSEPPVYAEMSAGSRKFGLHLPRSHEDQLCVGHAKVYFRVKDVDAHHRRVVAWGGKPSVLRDTAWMRMFSVTDHDGHRIYFAATDDSVHSIDPW